VSEITMNFKKDVESFNSQDEEQSNSFKSKIFVEPCKAMIEKFPTDAEKAFMQISRRDEVKIQLKKLIQPLKLEDYMLIVESLGIDFEKKYTSEAIAAFLRRYETVQHSYSLPYACCSRQSLQADMYEMRRGIKLILDLCLDKEHLNDLT
jgi:hypothetical protein